MLQTGHDLGFAFKTTYVLRGLGYLGGQDFHSIMSAIEIVLNLIDLPHPSSPQEAKDLIPSEERFWLEDPFPGTFVSAR
jgi:hypothetical protein